MSNSYLLEKQLCDWQRLHLTSCQVTLHRDLQSVHSPLCPSEYEVYKRWWSQWSPSLLDAGLWVSARDLVRALLGRWTVRSQPQSPVPHQDLPLTHPSPPLFITVTRLLTGWRTRGACCSGARPPLGPQGLVFMQG